MSPKIPPLLGELSSINEAKWTVANVPVSSAKHFFREQNFKSGALVIAILEGSEKPFLREYKHLNWVQTQI